MVQLWGEIQSGTENINESEKERRKRDRQRKTQADRHTGRDTNYVFTRLYQEVSEIQVSSSPVSTQVARLTDLSTHVKRLTGMRANSSPSKLTTIT